MPQLTGELGLLKLLLLRGTNKVQVLFGKDDGGIPSSLGSMKMERQTTDRVCGTSG